MIGAIGTALTYFFGALYYLFIMVSLGSFCFLAALVLIPLDVMTLVLSLGSARFEIFRAFQPAGIRSLSWYVENVVDPIR